MIEVSSELYCQLKEFLTTFDDFIEDTFFALVLPVREPSIFLIIGGSHRPVILTSSRGPFNLGSIQISSFSFFRLAQRLFSKRLENFTSLFSQKLRSWDTSTQGILILFQKNSVLSSRHLIMTYEDFTCVSLNIHC